MSPPDRQRRSPTKKDGLSVYTCGGPGAGKTTILARTIVHEVLVHHRQVVVFDPTGDVKRRCTEESAANERIDASITATVSRLDEAWCAIRGETKSWNYVLPRRVIFIQEKGNASIEQMRDAFLALMNASPCEGYVFVADEAHMIWPLPPPQDAALKALSFVRNRHQLLLTSTQRPQYTATLLRFRADHAAVFASDSKKFVDPGCAELGDPERFRRANELRKFQYLYQAPFMERDRNADLPIYDARQDPIPWCKGK